MIEGVENTTLLKEPVLAIVYNLAEDPRFVISGKKKTNDLPNLMLMQARAIVGDTMGSRRHMTP